MKIAMWSVDKSGNFKFSDRDNPAQLPLLEAGFSEDWLVEELSEKLAGQKLSAAQIKKYVLTETPCYLFRKALHQLEMKTKRLSIVEAPAGRKPGTYPEDKLDQIVLKFAASLFGR